MEGFSVAMICGVGCRCGLDPALLWLWRRLAAAALIQLLVWELPYAAGVALKRHKRKKERGRKEENKLHGPFNTAEDEQVSAR